MRCVDITVNQKMDSGMTEFKGRRDHFENDTYCRKKILYGELGREGVDFQ